VHRLQFELILEARLEIEVKSARRRDGDLHIAEIARLLQSRDTVGRDTRSRSAISCWV
jgi:hypothetical protein